MPLCTVPEIADPTAPDTSHERKTMKYLVTAFVTLSALTCTPAWANLELARKNNCTACHAVDKKVVGPSYSDVAKKYAGDKAAAKSLAAKVKGGTPGGVWGPVPMPPNPNATDADIQALVKWILAGAK